MLVSFAAGFLLAALTVQRNCGLNAEELQTLMASNASSSDFLDDREQVTEQELSQGALFTMSKTEQLEQLKFCQENQHSPSDTQLQAAGFAYVRADGIQPGLGAVAAPGHNVSMWVYQGTSKHHDIVSSSIEQGGAWEPHETREVVTKLERFQQARGLSKEQVYFIDIGANVGYFTVNAAALGYSVIAFEATTPNAFAIRQTLCSNPQLQKRVALVNKGLSDAIERCAVVAASDNVGDGHVECNKDAADLAASGLVVHGQFDLITLDSYVEGHLEALRQKVGVVKIDVEGFEDKIFKGAGTFMESIQPAYVVCEFHGTFSQGTTAEEMLNMFDRWGYTVHTEHFDGPVEPKDGFSTLAERTGAVQGAINLYFTRA